MRTISAGLPRDAMTRLRPQQAERRSGEPLVHTPGPARLLLPSFSLPRMPVLALYFLSTILLVWGDSQAQRLDPQPAFDAANKLYEQGHFAEAAVAYQTLLQSGVVSPGLYLNLGNARFKAGQKGRAIASYLLGLRLSPRDPSLRFNLQFVRQEVTGEETPPGPWWPRWLNHLTLDEWTILFTAAFWIWFALLALREIRLDWRKALRGYTASAGLAALGLFFCLDRAMHHRNSVRSAVVVAPEAVVRYGPLDESQVDFQLRDGIEVIVLDEKQGAQNWLLIRDLTGREGWLKQDEVILLDDAQRDGNISNPLGPVGGEEESD